MKLAVYFTLYKLFSGNTIENKRIFLNNPVFITLYIAQYFA